MSLDATRWAWRQKLSPAEKLVLLSLADRAGENHDCFPSTRRLVEDTGLHRETVFSAIDHLEKMGFIFVIRRRGAGNKYRLIGVEDRHKQSEKADQYEKPDGSEKPDATSTKNRTQTSTKNRTLNLPVNQSINPYGKNAFDRLTSRDWAAGLVKNFDTEKSLPEDQS